MMYYYYPDPHAGLNNIAPASNLSYGSNPAYSQDDFFSFFPQFQPLCASADGTTPPTVPAALLNQFVTMASASLSYSKWSTNWQYAMGLYIAHCITMFLSTSQGTGATGVIASSQPMGLKTSESVGDVSASYDYGSIVEDLSGYGTWKSTMYGQQLATMAKLAGMGGMTVR